MSAPAVLRGVDRGAFAVALGVRLRARGVPVGFTAIEDFIHALEALPPTSRGSLYWSARICLVRRHSELAVFEAVFNAVFDDAVLQLDPNARRKPLTPPPPRADDSLVSVPGKDSPEEEEGTGLPWATLPTTVGDSEDSDSSIGIPQRLPSELVGLADVPFENLAEADQQALVDALRARLAQWPTRRSRRSRPDPAGHRIALRATVARSRRTGWEPIDLVHERQVWKPRRVVMLCDVSQSMQAQATAYLHLMRALAMNSEAEVFAFATHLTRLTSVLSHRSAEVAIEEASAKVVDRFGGTRIARNIHQMLSSHHGGAVRGAIVIIASDGWDTDEPEQMTAAMTRLTRRAHRVIWMNPRASAEGFEPTVASMAAALPFCDQLLPANTFRDLEAVVAEITNCSGVTPSHQRLINAAG